MREDDNHIPVQSKPLRVLIVDGEIVLESSESSSPSFTPFAARETGKRLIEAADKLERR